MYIHSYIQSGKVFELNKVRNLWICVKWFVLACGGSSLQGGQNDNNSDKYTCDKNSIKTWMNLKETAFALQLKAH